LEPKKAASHHGRSGQQNQGKRDLRYHENIARPAAAPTIDYATAGFSNRAVEIAAEELARRKQSEQETRQNNQRDCKCEDAAIQSGVSKPRQLHGAEGDKQPQFKEGQTGARDATGESE